MLNDIELAELLCARFCHDLSGPLGAVNNGIEFLRDDNADMQARAIELVEASAMQGVSRLQFFRLAYGTAAKVGEANLSLLKELTEKLLAKSKVTLDWPDSHAEGATISLSHTSGKLLLNLITIANSALIHGGKLLVRLQAVDGGKRLHVEGSGEKIKVGEDVINFLHKKIEKDDITSRNVQLYVTTRLADQSKASLNIEHNDQTITLKADYTKT